MPADVQSGGCVVYEVMFYNRFVYIASTHVRLLQRRGNCQDSSVYQTATSTPASRKQSKSVWFTADDGLRIPIHHILHDCLFV